MAKNNQTPLAFVIADGKPLDLSDIHTSKLDTICDAMVAATESVYGSHIRIAAKLNDLMPFDWFDVEHQEVSDNAKALAPHKKVVLDAFKRAKHSNPSQPYKRIREYGRNLRAGLAPNGKCMADGSPLPAGEETTGEGANPAKRSPMLRNIEELTALWKSNAKLSADEIPAKVANAQVHIEAALAALGVDVRTIKTA